MNITKRVCKDCDYCRHNYNHWICLKEEKEGKIRIMADNEGLCFELDPLSFPGFELSFPEED